MYNDKCKQIYFEVIMKHFINKCFQGPGHDLTKNFNVY